MNNRQENYGLDNIEPLEPIKPIYDDNQRYSMDMEQPMTEYANQSTNVSSDENIVESSPQDEGTISYTEMPVQKQAPTIDTEVNENPNAKISLRGEVEKESVVSTLPEEKIDKGTLWMLLGLLLALLVVIIALPYLYELL